MKKLLTVCIVHQHPRVLLGYKKKGFRAGRWNGFGGKVEPGEGIVAAAHRELKEESGLVARDMTLLGRIEAHSTEFPDTLVIYFFRVQDVEGEPQESDEMKPQWFTVDAVPFHAMWPSDPYWFPLLLAGKSFKGSFQFGKDDRILSYELVEQSTPMFLRTLE